MSDEETPTCRWLRLIISIKAEDTTPATVALLTDTHLRVDTDTDMATDTDTDTQIHRYIWLFFGISSAASAFTGHPRAKRQIFTSTHTQTHTHTATHSGTHCGIHSHILVFIVK